jgi:hypothetical protein
VGKFGGIKEIIAQKKRNVKGFWGILGESTHMGVVYPKRIPISIDKFRKMCYNQKYKKVV